MPLDRHRHDLVFISRGPVAYEDATLWGAAGSWVQSSGPAGLFHAGCWYRAAHLRQAWFSASVQGRLTVTLKATAPGQPERLLAQRHVDCSHPCAITMPIDLDVSEMPIMVEVAFQTDGAIADPRWVAAAPVDRQPELAIVCHVTDVPAGLRHPVWALQSALAAADGLAIATVIVVDDTPGHACADALAQWPGTCVQMITAAGNGGLQRGVMAAIRTPASHVLILPGEAPVDGAMLTQVQAVLRHSDDTTILRARVGPGVRSALVVPVAAIAAHGLPLPIGERTISAYGARLAELGCPVVDWPSLFGEMPCASAIRPAWAMFYDTRDRLFIAALQGADAREQAGKLASQFTLLVLRYDYQAATALVRGLAAYNRGAKALLSWTDRDHDRLVTDCAPHIRPRGQRFPPLRTRRLRTMPARWRKARIAAALLIDLFVPVSKRLIRRGFIRAADMPNFVTPRPRLILIRQTSSRQIEQAQYRWRSVWRLTGAFGWHLLRLMLPRPRLRAGLLRLTQPDAWDAQDHGR